MFGFGRSIGSQNSLVAEFWDILSGFQITREVGIKDGPGFFECHPQLYSGVSLSMP